MTIASFFRDEIKVSRTLKMEACRSQSDYVKLITGAESSPTLFHGSINALVKTRFALMSLH
uniref:AlNc14C215G8992 protein n=1 Tax=Albugo laibachii Nc14 TaxID=890382 RepID=F0WRJ2_9STRA|nr:AlNc14C215G8992 [Albugo laibachii Nc14]|eukprot:CCA23955.1 AlNc14C215G8992 [Albugo laibachii Nc14]